MSCERKSTGRLVSSRPLWSNPSISVQAWKSQPGDDGQVQDLIRIAFSVDSSSWFLPWSKFFILVNDGNVTVGRNLTGNRFGGNQFAVRYRQCHRLSADPLTYCSGHDYEIVFGQVQVAEICELVNQARDEWARLFGGECGGLPLPRQVHYQLITEALRARGALVGTPSSEETEEDSWVRRDELFDACGGPDPDPKPLDIEPSEGRKESYDDEPNDSDTREQADREAEQARRRTAEEESACQLRERLIAQGIIRPVVSGTTPVGDSQSGSSEDADQ